MTEQQPVHIAHLIWHFSTGGLENGVVNLINHLPAGQYRHSIITLSGHDPKFAARIATDNVQFYCLDKAPGHDWGTFSRLNQLLKHLKPDVLHSRNLATLELQTVGWWRKVPLRLHGEHGWDSADIGGSSKKNQLIRRLLQRFINHFICLSAESEQYLRSKIGIPAARLSRICNGVDVERFAKAAPVTLWPNSQSISPVLFISVGRLATVKNHALLLRAFALLLQQAPQFSDTARLVLVGDGPCRAALEQQSQALGISDKVHFSGERQDISSVMQGADVFVLPSLAEGISNTLLEAMAAGTPVIATAVGGNPDLLPPTLRTTNLVPSDDAQALMQAMLRYLKQPQALKTDAELVKNHCHQHFSIDTMVNRYKRIYDITRTQR